MKVSVVVTHYEQPDDLARTLACLARQDLPADVQLAEVVVSDDGSDPLPALPDGIRLITQPDLGFRAALARNRGVAATSGGPDDVVVMLDADTSPEPGFLRALTAPLRDEPDLLVVGRRRHAATGALGDGSGPGDPLAGAVEHELPEPAWLRRGWAETDDLRAADDASFRHVISAVLGCTRGWWEQVGGFDAGFDAYGGEDWELAHRWWRAGGRLRHVPGAVAWHHGPEAGSEARTWTAGEAAAPDPAIAQAVALARRVDAWPVGFRGLRAAPPRVVVTHDALTTRELLLAVDGLLAAVPQAQVCTDDAVLLGLGDPRVVGDGAARSHPDVAGLEVHLRAGVVGEPPAWRALLEAPLHATHVEVGSALVLTDLRRARRAHRGLEEAGTGQVPLPAGLRPAGATTLAAWLGGWWA